MKVSIVCNSLLLEESLKVFLKNYHTNYKNSQIVVSDHNADVDKPIFIISNSEYANLKAPFSPAKLLVELEKFYNSVSGKIVEKSKNERVEELVKEFTTKLNEILNS